MTYGLAQLLQRPCGAWRGGNVAMDQTSAAVLDHHAHVEQSERGRHDEREIAVNDALGMLAQERRPPQVAPRSAWRATGQILPYGSWRNLNSRPVRRAGREAAANRQAGTSGARTVSNRRGASGSSSRGARPPRRRAS